MSEAKANAVHVVYLKEGSAHGLVPIQAAADGQEHSEEWYPLIPLGHFHHDLHGDFSITEPDAHAMIANFEAGLPFGGPIPIDEDGDHDAQAEAFGWIEELALRDEAIWGRIKWSDLGREKIDNGRYRYLSPTFMPRGREFAATTVTEEGVTNLLIAAALTNRPFFGKQPGLIAASMGYEFEPIGGLQAASEDESGSQTIQTSPRNSARTTAAMEVKCVTEELVAKVRAMYEEAHDKLDDEAWAELLGEVESDEALMAWAKEQGLEVSTEEGSAATDEGGEDQDAAGDDATGEGAQDELTISRAELERLQAEADKAKDTETKLAEQSKELASVKASMGEVQANLRRVELEKAVAGSIYGGKSPGPAAIEAIVDLQLNPCEETVKAFMGHLEENHGSLALVQMGEEDAVRASTGDTNEDWLTEKGLAADAEEKVRKIAAKDDCTFEQAYDKYQSETYGE